jgi:hypothetical protein
MVVQISTYYANESFTSRRQFDFTESAEEPFLDYRKQPVDP